MTVRLAVNVAAAAPLVLRATRGARGNLSLCRGRERSTEGDSAPPKHTPPPLPPPPTRKRRLQTESSKVHRLRVI